MLEVIAALERTFTALVVRTRVPTVYPAGVGVGVVVVTFTVADAIAEAPEESVQFIV